MFDRNISVIEPISLYPSMKEFRLGMCKYVIDKEFELGIEATDKIQMLLQGWRLFMKY
jgi:hypothetical protein